MSSNSVSPQGSRVVPLFRLQHDWELSVKNVRKSAAVIGTSREPNKQQAEFDPLIFVRGEGGHVDPDEQRRLEDEQEKAKVNFDTFWMQHDDSDQSASAASYPSSKSHQVDFKITENNIEAVEAKDRLHYRVTRCEVTPKSGCTLEVHYTHENIQHKALFRSAANTWRHIHSVARRRSVDCIDVSEGGVIGISGSTDGQLRVWEAQDGTLRRSLEGHVGDIYVAKLLPSAEVAMSSGADMQIKIWRLSDGLCAVTLRGHTAAVKAISFIDRGRNFISCGKDGTVRLWDCASQSCITNLVNAGGTYFNDCRIEENVSLLSARRGSKVGDHPAQDQRDFGTEGKLAMAVTDNGTMYTVDVRTRKILDNITVTSEGEALRSCFLTTSAKAIVGTENGMIITYDLRNASMPLQTWRHSGTPSPILSMAGFSPSQICFSTGDGLCALYNFDKNEMGIEFTGSDYDPVYGITASPSTGSVFTACRDGAVRKYIV